MAETLDIPLATGIWAGLLSGLPVVIAALSAGCFLNRHQRIHVPQDLASGLDPKPWVMEGPFPT